MSEDFWALRRMQYRKLAGLCVAVDDAISQITLLSFSNNLFFISVQLLHSLRYADTVETQNSKYVRIFLLTMFIILF